MNEEIAIKIENISKNFLLPHEKKTSLKSVFTSLFGGKTTYTQQHALNDISFEVKRQILALLVAMVAERAHY